VLDLQATLSRADGTKVHRYLPLVIPASARHYVRDAIVSAVATGARFKVKGDLHDMPFKAPARRVPHLGQYPERHLRLRAAQPAAC
jgi:uncharacterized protein YhdP